MRITRLSYLSYLSISCLLSTRRAPCTVPWRLPPPPSTQILMLSGAARSGAVARTDRQHSAYTLLRLTLTLTLTLTQTLTQTLPLTLTLTLPLPLTFTLAQTLTLTLARYALLRLPASGAPPMSPTGDEVSARRWVPLKRLAGEVALGGAPARSKCPLGSYLAASQLGSCASSGRAWRLWAAGHYQ